MCGRNDNVWRTNAAWRTRFMEQLPSPATVRNGVQYKSIVEKNFEMLARHFHIFNCRTDGHRRTIGAITRKTRHCFADKGRA
jgi:hypothetical protein